LRPSVSPTSGLAAGARNNFYRGTTSFVCEGCGRAYLGEVDGANILKIHRRTGKLSDLIQPDFDTHPHPTLLRCVKLSLHTRQLECYDHAQAPTADPPPEGEVPAPVG
jgi:hypothetical protein